VSSDGDGNAMSLESSSCSQNSLANSDFECSLSKNKPYKIVILGALGVGKSAIAQQFMTSEYLFDTVPQLTD
jgi:GTPase SAR1 family protein